MFEISVAEVNTMKRTEYDRKAKQHRRRRRRRGCGRVALLQNAAGVCERFGPAEDAAC